MTKTEVTSIEGENRASERWLAWLLLLPTALIVLFAISGPIVSGDLWWHLGTGEWIIDNGELPEHDPFSHTAGDKEWTLEEYGSQILFAGLYRFGGLPILRLVGGLLALLTLIVAYRTARSSLPPFWATALTALFALLFALKWELRPHLLSVFFLFRLHQLLFPHERKQDPSLRVIVEVFLLTVVWVQLHAEAIFVPILAIAGLIGAILGTVLESERGRARITAWLGVLLAAALGSFCSPEGWNQVRYALSDSSIPRDLILEWAPYWTWPGDPRFLPVTTGVFIATGISILFSLHVVLKNAFLRVTGKDTGLPWERIGFLAVCVLMALLARRFFWLTIFPVIDLTAMLLNAAPSWKKLRVVPATLALALALPLLNSHYPTFARQSFDTGSWKSDINAGLFPLHSTEFVDESGLEGNLFHRYEWGGFLGFHLWPTCHVFLDGRTVLFSHVIPERWQAEHWESSFDNFDGRAHANQVFNNRNVRIIVMPSFADYGQGPIKWKPPGAHINWIRVWADDTAVVWLRATDAENLSKVTAWYSSNNLQFDASQGFVEAQVFAAHPEWIEERHLLDPFVRNLIVPAIGDSDELRLKRTETWLRLRMERSARWELEHLVANLTGGDQKTYAEWINRIKTKGALDVFQSISRGDLR
ncbi:MAG: hypothetical protein ACI87A_001601 [Planctomycetota bacterium]